MLTYYTIKLKVDASQEETTKVLNDIDRFIFMRTKGQEAYDAKVSVEISSFRNTVE